MLMKKKGYIEEICRELCYKNAVSPLEGGWDDDWKINQVQIQLIVIGSRASKKVPEFVQV